MSSLTFTRPRPRCAAGHSASLALALALAFAPAASARQEPAAPVPTAAPPAATPSASSSGPVTHERTLPNGMKVIVREDHRAPTVVHLVLYRIGSIDEVNGLTGVSHVLEHMMFKGTRTLAVGEFSRKVAQRGGRENAFTSRDYTGYFQQVQRDHLSEMMKLEADRMANLVVDDDEFGREVRVVMEERRLRTDDRATALVYEQMMASAFDVSPYRRPIIGWMTDLQSLTAADVRNWYERWYTPSNATLVVAGDVNFDEVWKLAQQHYGPITARELPVRKPQNEPSQRGVRRATVKAPAENPYLLMAYRVPRLENVEGDSDPFSLQMLSAVLDADENGRLTRNIVRGSRVGNQAGAGYDMTGRGPSLFVLDGTPAEGQTTAELEKALRAEVRRVADKGVRDDELERIKAQYVAQEIYKRDSIMGQAMEIASMEAIGKSWRDLDRILERIRAVDAAQVQAVARKYFDDESLTVVTLDPQPIDPQQAARNAAPPPGELR